MTHNLQGVEDSLNEKGDPLVGQVIASNYAIVEKIGSGSFSNVYRATNQSLQKPVAVKVLTKGLMSASYSAERFEREAKSVCQLNHPATTLI